MLFFEKIALFTLMVLIPLVPAWVLFKYLQASASIKGTVAGIPMELGGAIGGYFAVAAFFATVVGPHIYPQSVRQIHVRGTMKFAAGPAPSAADIKAEMHPPDLDVRDGKNFEWPVTVVDGESSMVVLQPVGYEGQTLYLSGDPPFGAPNYKHHIETVNGVPTLVFDEPIVFQRTATPVAQTADAGR